MTRVEPLFRTDCWAKARSVVFGSWIVVLPVAELLTATAATAAAAAIGRVAALGVELLDVDDIDDIKRVIQKDTPVIQNARRHHHGKAHLNLSSGMTDVAAVPDVPVIVVELFAT